MKRKHKRALLWIILALLLIAAGVVIFMGMRRAFTYEAPVIEQAGQAVHAVPTPTPKPTQQQGLSQFMNILVLGVDNNSLNSMDQLGNADGVIFATINPDTKEIVFTSFMRDTRVRVNDSGYDKVTNVYHTGGVDLLRRTMEENFEIPIDYYALFNYLDIVEIVDAVGGVDAELSVDEIYYMEPKIKDLCSLTGNAYEDNALSVDQAGRLTLNGIQAAAYSRIRPAEGGYDAGRTERGRNVITAVLGKAFRLGTSDMLKFAQVFYDKIQTDIPDSVFMELGMNASELRGYKQISDRIPIDGAYESGNTGSGYYVVPDMDINVKHLKDSVYEGKHD